MSEPTVISPVPTPAPPAPPAPPSQPPGWFRRHKKLTIAGVVVGLLAIGSAAAAGGSEDKAATTDDPPTTEAPAPAPTEAPVTEAPAEAPPATEAPARDIDGDEDEVDDLGAPVMDAPDAIGVSYIHIPVTNNSSKASSYMIDVAVESADGATQYETTIATLSGVEAGQAASAEGMVAWGADPAPADATVRITTVQRTASA